MMANHDDLLTKHILIEILSETSLFQCFSIIAHLLQKLPGPWNLEM